jgi:hypothetical protein
MMVYEEISGSPRRNFAMLVNSGASAMLRKPKHFRKREHEADGETFLANNLAQHQAWSARNPGRVNEIAAGVCNKAKDLQRFRCDLCDHNAATQYALDEHNRTQDHLDAVAKGVKEVKPLSVSALNRRAIERVRNEGKEEYLVLWGVYNN